MKKIISILSTLTIIAIVWVISGIIGTTWESQDEATLLDTAIVVEAVGNNAATFELSGITEQDLMEICGSTYAYDYFATTEKSEAYLGLYNRIDEKADSFFLDYSNDVPKSGAIFDAQFSDLDLTADEAIFVWNMYRNDNPLYYWMTGTVSVDSDNLWVFTDEAYYSADARKEYNMLLCEKLGIWLKATQNETSPYRVALIYYDILLNSMEYSYEDDGYTPSDEAWAHNILGVFEKGEGVCESYARTFSLLLNASGVENVYVTGKSGNEAHAWNMAKMDDGNWYWFDATWDDPEMSTGYSFRDILGTDYKYFCVNDNQICESWNYVTGQSFLSDHEYNLPSGEGVDLLYELPQRSSEKFESDSNIGVIKSVFTLDEMTYTIIGYDKVQLIEVSKDGELIIPESVTYAGREYTVCSIGTMTNNIFDELGSVIPFECYYSTVTIPKSVRFIWGCSFRGYVEEYIVAEDNSSFVSVDGVIFTKSLYTLVAYPSNSKTVKYQIPDETVRVASNAFFRLRNTNHIVIGKNVAIFGIANWGLGYLDDPSKNMGGSFIGSEMGDIRSGIYNNACNSISFSVHPDNEYYKEVDGVIYNRNMTLLLVVGDCFVTEVVIPNTVKEIETRAFINLTSLTKLVIPESIEYMPDTWTFWDCIHLYEIYNYSNFDLTIGSSEYGEIFKYARHIYTSPEEESRLFKTDDGFIYYYEEGSVPELVTYMGTNTTVILPDSINGMAYTVADRLLAGRYDIKELVINENITGVHHWSFSRTWPEKITIASDFIIMNAMFTYNPNLKEVVLLEEVTQLSWMAFDECPNLKLIRTKMTAEQWISEANKNRIILPDSCVIRCIDVRLVYNNGEYTAYKYGDVDSDGLVTEDDSEMLLKYITGWDVDVIEDSLDVNGDGKVNIRDVATILRFLAR